jgi:hypothetical protein
MAQKNIDLSKLHRGPVRHPVLPLTLVARVNYLRTTFLEAYPQSMDQWLDGFKRDANPEREVMWWERLARCYGTYNALRELSVEQKRAAFKIIFSLLMSTNPETLEKELAMLPDGALEEIAANLQQRTQ